MINLTAIKPLKIMPFIVMLTVWSSSLFSSAQVVDEKVELRLQDTRKDFEALVLEKRELYRQYMRQATRDFYKQKYFTALIHLDDAERIFSKNYLLYNLRGSIYANIHLPKQAMAEYQKALTINPYDIQVNLNLIDLLFKQKSYDLVIKLTNRINVILIQEKNLERLPSYAYRDFKCLVAFYKMEAKNTGVWGEKILELKAKYSYMDDHPYYYFTQALQCLDESNKEEALLWIMKSYKVFQKPQVIALWVDVLVESGYLDREDWHFYSKKPKF